MVIQEVRSFEECGHSSTKYTVITMHQIRIDNGRKTEGSAANQEENTIIFHGVILKL